MISRSVKKNCIISRSVKKKKRKEECVYLWVERIRCVGKRKNEPRMAWRLTLLKDANNINNKRQGREMIRMYKKKWSACCA